MITSLVIGALAAATQDSSRITIDDIEARFRQLTGQAESTVDQAKPALIRGAVVGGVLLLLLIYLLGRRQGRRRATVLEIRRVV